MRLIGRFPMHKVPSRKKIWNVCGLVSLLQLNGLKICEGLRIGLRHTLA